MSAPVLLHADPRPLIALSPNAFPAEDRHFYKLKALEYGEMSMAACVREAGGLPVLAYRAGVEDAEGMRAHADALMQRCAGLLLTGGSDVAPGNYGDAAADPAWCGDPTRDRWELSLYAAARSAGRPVLGVCRGMQLMNVAHGGTLWQDLPTLRPDSQVHRSQELYCGLVHEVTFAPGSRIAELMGASPYRVNSVHHQGVKLLAEGLDATAWASDGVVEAFEVRTAPWSLGVQWHPEWMPGDAGQERLFAAFVAAAMGTKR